MTPSDCESVLVQFNEFFSWPFVRSAPELAALEPLATKRLQFMIPLAYLSKSLHHDAWSVFWEKCRITRSRAEVSRPWLLWTLILLFWLLPRKLVIWLEDWYARTRWIKRVLNLFFS